MIDITIDREGHEITAAGHAGYGERGSDIICSAVSTLLHTLASYITLHGELLCGEPVVECDDGYMVISFVPKPETSSKSLTGSTDRGAVSSGLTDHGELEAVFDVICHGLREIGKQYGAYVKVSEEYEGCPACRI